jgi:solute carrier family 45 protein 1/2/4
MGWFPYLFYSTTYVAEVMAQEIGAEPDPDVATRAGSLALLIYSFVAIIAGTLLPYLAARDRRLLRPDKNGKDGKNGKNGKAARSGRVQIVRNPLAGRDANQEEGESDGEDSESGDSEEEARDVEMERIREMVREWKMEAARQGRPLKLPTSMCNQTLTSS